MHHASLQSESGVKALVSWILKRDDVAVASQAKGARYPSAVIAAALAQSMELHVATIDPKSVQRRSLSVQRDGDLIEVDIPHLPAAPAHEMMVVIRIDFELDGGAAALQRADQTGAHQFLHVAIHGRM